MKRGWLTLVLALVMLCKCEASPREGPTPSDHIPSETKPTESVGFCEPETLPVTVLSDGLRIYPLGQIDATGITFCGSDILLFSGDVNSALTLLSGKNLAVMAQTDLHCPISADGSDLQATDQGITYVDHVNRQLVFLDPTLAEIQQIPLPPDSSTMALSADARFLYYCTGEALRVLDLQTGLDRLIRLMEFSTQALTGLHQADRIAQCTVVYSDGTSHDLFVSTETGVLLHESAVEVFLYTHDDFYFTTQMDGEYPELISGSSHFGPSILVPQKDYAGFLPIPSRQSLLLYRHSDDNFSTMLDFYDLQTGIRSACVEFPYHITPRSLQPDPEGNTLWFLYFDEHTKQDILCAWDPDRSASDDAAQYLQNRWNRNNPDQEGLTECQALAREIGKRHGVQILLWTEATEVQPEAHTLVPEYQVPLIQKRLRELDQALSLYPAGFLKEAASGTASGQITICLVREIHNNTVSGSVTGLQFWDQRANAYAAVTMDSNMTRRIHHELFHIIDSRILGNCNVYDDWNSLNSGDLPYDFCTAPGEDRARIMEYAMMPDQEDTFQSAPMQAKLRKLCLGIRKAFRLESATCHWESYLAQPLP